jgi:dTDP-4-amino-4,6-dideoxygalactose transaminase
MSIKFVDLSPIHLPLAARMNKAIQQVIENNEYVGGVHVDRFEANFAQYLKAKHCISCANGTDALEMALWALGIKEGDEVIVPAHSWISTASAVVSAGATPVFVPCNIDDYTINADKIEAKISPATKAIIAVHLYGHSADMGRIQQIAQAHQLKVIEDAAQAHGAAYNGIKCGTLGDIGCFSFYPSKNLGCLGDGGCIVTNSDGLAAEIRAYKNCGQQVKNSHVFWGRNSRLDNLQAAILDIKLPLLDVWNEERRAVAAFYNAHLDSKRYELPVEKNYASHVYHIYCIRTSERDAVMARLDNAGIQYGIHYPGLLPNLVVADGNKITGWDNYADTILSLPVYAGMKREDMQKVVEVLNS